MNKLDIQYFCCQNCGMVRTETPFWLIEAYREPIHMLDTGHLKRNILTSLQLKIFLSLNFPPDHKFIDYGGGTGILVRLMRDLGCNFFWADKYAKNVFARGFSADELKEKVDAVTLFECVEHFDEPVSEIEDILSQSNVIIFSTELIPSPPPREWWYYSFETGQHVSFYTSKSLKILAERFEKQYLKIGNFHVFAPANRFSQTRLGISKILMIGLSKLFQRCIKGLTWDDFLLLKKNKTLDS
jgi:hypothetical protein